MKIKCNAIKNEFSFQSFITKIQLFNSQCMTLYGCCLWNIESLDFNQIQIEWRKCCRALLELPKRTHNNLIPGLMNSFPIDEIIYIRFLNFFIKALKNKNPLVEFMTRSCLLSSNSCINGKINIVLEKLTLNYQDIFFGKKIKIEKENETNDWKIRFLVEVLNVRDKMLECNINREDLTLLLNYLCTGD